MHKNLYSLSTLILLLFMLFQATDSRAQDTTRFSLQEVIRKAQDNSLDAQIARHRFKAAYWTFRNFRADYLPNLALDATLPNINRSIEAITLPDGTSNYTSRSLTNYSVAMSLSQQIGFTGGEVFLSTGLQQMNNYYTDTSTSQFLANMVNIGIRQPIFKYNAYKWDKKIKPMEYDQAKRQLIEANESVASTAVDRFFSLLIAQIRREIAVKNQSNYDTLYRIAQGRYQLGKIAESDLLQLELNLLQANASVEDADLTYQTSLDQFRSYLLLNDDDAVTLIPPNETRHFIVPADKAIDEAKNNSSDGIAFQVRLIEAESRVNQARLDGRFDAEIYAVLGLTQTADAVKDAYQNPLDEERVTVGITMPLLDWGRAKGNIKLAESNQDLEVASVEQERIDYIQNIYVNVMQFNMQKNQLRIAAKSDTVAQKRYDVTEKRYMIGKVNDILDLNQAQIDNDNAKVGYYRALMTYWKSYYLIRQLTLYDFEHDQPISITYDDLIR